MRNLLLVTCLVAMGAAVAAGSPPTVSGCSCATAPRTDGWCEAHGVGWVAAVEIRSRLLYDTLDAHGHVVDLSTFGCPTCQGAIAVDGFCDEHRVGFVGRLAYFSRLTHELARGVRHDPATIECADCRAGTRTHGWCAVHARGFVGPVTIGDRAAWRRAVEAVEVLRKANETVSRCELCALAMVTDTRCPRCKVSYRNGVASPGPAGGPDAPTASPSP